MRVVPLAGARLPDAFVRLLPVTAHVVAKFTQHVRRLPIELATFADKLNDRVDDLPVDVQLNLVRCGVPDADRARPEVARELAEHLLLARPLAIHVVQNAQLRAGQAGAVEQPAHEGLGFAIEIEPEQGAAVSDASRSQQKR